VLNFLSFNKLIICLGRVVVVVVVVVVGSAQAPTTTTTTTIAHTNQNLLI
jgi:hypothetical protein